MLKQSQIKIYITLTLCLSILCFALPLKAQTLQNIIDSTQNDIQISISPEYPKAGDVVAIHLQSVNVPLDQAKISWIVGGKVINKGLGLTDFNTTAGKIGSISKITAAITTTNGSTVNKTINIQPADIDLLWQATSYVPPFYQGKALYPHQGLITFTAVPNLSSTGNISKSINSYVYIWKKDGDILSDFSGYGKNTFTLSGPIISRPFKIEVEVKSTDGISVGIATETITPRDPKVLLYENNPLLGILYNQRISNYVMPNKELTISAVPYFFNAGSEPSNLTYSWTMNNKSIANQDDPSTITVRNENNTSGSATIGLKVTNTLKILQSTSNSINLNFGNNNPNSL